jgi:hypothetical protein
VNKNRLIYELGGSKRLTFGCGKSRPGVKCSGLVERYRNERSISFVAVRMSSELRCPATHL